MDQAELEEALYDELTDNTALMAAVSGVYNTYAPDDATYPFVIIAQQSARDEYTFSQRVYRDTSYLIVVVDESPSSLAATDAAELVDAALTDADIDGVLAIRRTESAMRPEVVDGIQYWHVGGIYQIVVEA